jgi:hypothetical protein
MRSFAEVEFSQASHAYAVANTPLFLIRKLQQDPVVHEISRSFSGEQILEELRRSVEHEPRGLVDYVRPYVYLTALSRQQQDLYLKSAGQLANSAKWDWFEYMRQVLLSTYAPTSAQEVQPRSAILNSEPTRTDAPVLQTEITLG